MDVVAVDAAVVEALAVVVSAVTAVGGVATEVEPTAVVAVDAGAEAPLWLPLFPFFFPSSFRTSPTARAPTPRAATTARPPREPPQLDLLFANVDSAASVGGSTSACSTCRTSSSSS